MFPAGVLCCLVCASLYSYDVLMEMCCDTLLGRYVLSNPVRSLPMRSAPSSGAGCYGDRWHGRARSSSDTAGIRGTAGTDNGNPSCSRCGSTSTRPGGRLRRGRDTETTLNTSTVNSQPEVKTQGNSVSFKLEEVNLDIIYI